jgi:hypothetical protein
MATGDVEDASPAHQVEAEDAHHCVSSGIDDVKPIGIGDAGVQQRSVSSKAAQQSVAMAAALVLLGLSCCVGGLVGVWWSGSYNLSYDQSDVVFSSTLWRSTLSISGSGAFEERSETLDDACRGDTAQQAHCGKIKVVRFCIFLVLSSILVSCPASWLGLSALWKVDAFEGRPHANKSDTNGMWEYVLVVSALCKTFAFVFALLAVVAASTLDFDESSTGIGVGGAGFALTIVSMVLCLFPSAVLELFAWRWTYWCSSSVAIPPSVDSRSPVEVAVPKAHLKTITV